MSAKILKIADGNEIYEVGKDNVKSIESSNQGSSKNTTYLITYNDDDYLFYSTPDEHDVIYEGEMEWVKS